MASFSIAQYWQNKTRLCLSVRAGIKFRTIFLIRAAQRFSAVLPLYVLDSNFQLYFSTCSYAVLNYGPPYMQMSLSELSPYVQVSLPGLSPYVQVSLSELCLRMCRSLFRSYVSPYVQVSLSDLCVSVCVGISFRAMSLCTCKYPFQICVSPYV